MLMIKGTLCLFVILIFNQFTVNAKNIGHDADYDASGDYFEVVTTVSEESVTKEQPSVKSDNSDTSDENTDDGVTCSDTNVTQVLSNYELENYVLVLFKVNVSANERELF